MVAKNPPGGVSQKRDQMYDTSFDVEKAIRDAEGAIETQMAEAAARAAGGRRSRASGLQRQLTGAYDQSTRDIESAYSSLESMLRGQTNPFAGFVAQEAPVSGGLAELLGSQGVSNLPVQQLGAALQAQNTGQATAFQNLANTMRDLYGASQAGSLADVSRMRTESRRNAATNRQDILKMLIQALRSGAI